MEIKGSKALVTGASSGIGRAIAEQLRANGAEVWGTSRNPPGEGWPDGVTPLILELGSSDSIEAAWRSQSMDSIGFDIVVNNAGYGAFGRFAEIDFEDWEAQVRALLVGTMKVSRLALPGLVERSGYLVNVSSLAADFPVIFMSGYNAAKAGLSGFTESLVIEFKTSGLKVVDFRPGDIRSSFNANMLQKTGKNPEEGCVTRVWRRIEERLSASPEPEFAARKLVACISRDQVGTIRVGTFFQARVAPLLARLAPTSLTRAANVAYYTK